MFPIFSIKIDGLEPDVLYSAAVCFENVDAYEYRFFFQQRKNGFLKINVTIARWSWTVSFHLHILYHDDLIQDLKMKWADFEDETKELKMQFKKSVTAVDDSVAKCLQLQRETEKELEEKYRLQIDEGNARIAELNNEVVKQSKILTLLPYL